MKTYNNGPRKGMMYGGATRRKPMMYGGMATKKKKNMQMGGMMSTTPMQQGMQRRKEPMTGMPMMASGGNLKMVKNKAGKMVPFYAADGKGKS
jgi:hypothetical protein